MFPSLSCSWSHFNELRAKTRNPSPEAKSLILSNQLSAGLNSLQLLKGEAPGWPHLCIPPLTSFCTICTHWVFSFFLWIFILVFLQCKSQELNFWVGILVKIIVRNMSF